VTPEQIDRLLRAKALLTEAQTINAGYLRSVAQLERSRDLFRAVGNTTEANIAEVWAATLLPVAGRVADGRRRLLAAIADSETRNYRVLQPAAYYWLGISEILQNEISAYYQHLKTALRIAEASHNSFEAQHAQDSLAAAYTEMNELEPALSYGSQMLFARDLYYQTPSQYWREKGTLSDLALKFGYASAAQALAQEGLEILLDPVPEHVPKPRGSMLNDSLAQVIAAAAFRRDFPTALKNADDSLTLAAAREISDENTRTTAEIYRLRGEVKRSAGDPAGALADLDRALELFARVPELTISLYRTHKERLFAYRELGRRTEFEQELKTVLLLSDQYRSTIREDASRQAFFDNEQDVFQAAIDDALDRHDSAGAFALVEQSKSRSLLDFVSSKRSIAEVENSFGPITRPISRADIQRRMPEGVQVLQYVSLPNRLAIWVVTRSRFDLVEVPTPAATLEAKIRSYRAAVIAKTSPNELAAAGRELYDLLIPAGLDRTKQLCFLADEFLHQLPFASLVSPSGKFLVEEFALSYAPSAAVMVVASENAAKKERNTNETILAVGNPEFDRDENPNLPDLRAAEAEAQAVARGYQAPQVLLGAAATKEEFLKHFAEFEVVHFAGHFVVNPASPENSKLLFAGGVVRSSELAAYKLARAKLVVLSACETGFERYNQSEGAIGAARSFLALGSPLVLASQWPVDSEPTKDLMIAFHRNRKVSGLTSAESLRRAQLELLSRSATSAPYYWAAFSLFGGYTNY
jgi:CHAT domain-containing protein